MLTEEWRKAPESESAGCVWVRLHRGRVEVARTRVSGGGPDEEGPVSQFTPHEWRIFLNGVRTSSRFDLPG
ncbi:DUF397 domain-containing protein [Nonomuraea sp. CA-141351]|uniref:DUF397 domain-containing protein n=1 Tax=Nonomuraea sp. CA-141351 TaxID=3239996 RepID=UPI003D8BC185